MSDTPTSDVQITTDSKVAGRVLRLSKRADRRAAAGAGTLMMAANNLGAALKVFRKAAEDNSAITESEILLAEAFTKRLRRKAEELATVHLSGMKHVASLLMEVERALKEAHRGSSPLKRLQQRNEVDTRLFMRLKASVQDRAREAARALADLEQAVDPDPGYAEILEQMDLRAADEKKSQEKGTSADMAPGTSSNTKRGDE